MTDYSNQNITGQNLTSVNLTGANFTNTNATNVNFTNATITNATFKNTLLTGATLTGITFSNLQKGQLLLNASNLRNSSINNVTSLTLAELRTIQPSISLRSLNNITSVSVSVPNNNGSGYIVSVTPTTNQVICIFVAINQNVTLYTSGNVIRTIRNNGSVIQDIDNSNATITFLKIGSVSYRLSAGNADGVIALIPIDVNLFKINEGGISDIIALNSGSTSRIVGYSWDYILNNSSTRIAKVNFGSLNINMLTSRVRGVIHIKLGSGDFGYPLIFFNNTHNYPSSASNTNELSRSFNITHSSTWSNQSIYANANTTLFSIYQDGSPCFANIAFPNISSMMTIKFDIDLQKQKNNMSRQTICSGEWTWTSKTVGSAASYIYHGYFQRITELAITNSYPIASYNFDSNANDSSTNGNNLTNVNSVTYNTSDFKLGTAAASFNGSNYFEISNDGRFSPDNFTIALWVKAVNISGNHQSIATCRDGYSFRGWIIYISPSNNLEFWTGTSSGWSGNDVSLYSNFGGLNTWVHIAFTLNKSTSTLLLYVNGTILTTTSRTYSNNTATNLRIGAGGDFAYGELFVRNGTLMDDFRFYNKVLTASEISNVYSGALTNTVANNNNIMLTDIGIGSYANSNPTIENVNINLEVINLPTFS